MPTSSGFAWGNGVAAQENKLNKIKSKNIETFFKSNI
jgi:hypothetical protein